MGSTAGAQVLTVETTTATGLTAPAFFDNYADGRTIIASAGASSCQLTWIAADGETVVNSLEVSVDDDMDAPLPTACAGVRVIDEDSVAVLAWVDDARYVLVGVDDDGTRSFTTALDAASLDQPGAALAGGADGLLVTGQVGDQDAETVVARFNVEGQELFFQTYAAQGDCITDLQQPTTVGVLSVVMARACEPDSPLLPRLILGGGALSAEPLLDGTDAGDNTFEPRALVGASPMVYIAGARLDGGAATALRWVGYNLNSNVLTRDFDVADSSLRAEHALQVSLGGEGLFLSSDDAGAISGLQVFSPATGELVAEADAVDFAAFSALRMAALADSGARALAQSDDDLSLLTLANNEPDEPEEDADEDGVGDDADNCPETPNADQADDDEDGVGDVCDNCPEDANEDQGDDDSDDAGDVCDNCPGLFNPTQSNIDDDDFGDACDDDIDGDGVPNSRDNCPEVSNGVQRDNDIDGIGNACDDDNDGDGVDDSDDNCPADANRNQSDIDRDDIGDVCDSDRDGDGVINGADNCPDISNINQLDVDGDGIGNECDTLDSSRDADNDGVPDALDNCPEDANADQRNIDGDSEGDLCDDDVDGDSIPNGEDNCVRVPNQFQEDRDSDGEGDSCDFDDDEGRDVPEPGEVTIEPRVTPPPPVDPAPGANQCSAVTPTRSSPNPASLLVLALGLLLAHRRRR